MMFISYCDASVIEGRHYVGYLIKTKSKTYSQRREIITRSKYLTPNILEFLAFEMLVDEILLLQLNNGIIYFDSDFVNRSLTGRSKWFKKRTQRMLISLNKRNINFKCVCSKDNFAHEIVRGQ